MLFFFSVWVTHRCEQITNSHSVAGVGLILIIDYPRFTCARSICSLNVAAYYKRQLW